MKTNMNDEEVEEPEENKHNDADGYTTVKDGRKVRKRKSKGKNKKKKSEKPEMFQTPISPPLHSGDEPQTDSTSTLHPDSSSLESDDMKMNQKKEIVMNIPIW